jgi:aspartate aminotransferase/aminotransferase
MITSSIFASRMNHLQASGIRKMFELASKMKNPIDFSLGQPDFDVPENVKEAAIRAIRDGKNGYSQTTGIEPLRTAIAESLTREQVPFGSCMVTSGASGGLLLALLALVEAGDEVLFCDPGFVAYEPMIRLAGATPVRISIYPDFKLTPENLRRHITAKTKALIFNSPGNPTGVAQEGDEIAELAKITREFGIRVISDEVYDLFTYDVKHQSWLKYDSSAVLVRAFSKSWGMAGWRSGYAAGPSDLLDQMARLQQFSYVCVNQPTQWACIEALKTDVSERIAEYKKKRDLVYNSLKDHFRIVKPTGTFFMFPEAPQQNTEIFLQRCVERELLIVPGQAFSERNTHFRLSFAHKNDVLEAGCKILVDIARRST